MNLIPHIKGAEKVFGIGCLHELGGTIESIADKLAAKFDSSLLLLLEI